MVDDLEHTDGVIGDNLVDSDEFHENSYSYSDVLDNMNTSNTYVRLKQAEGVSKYFKVGETIVYFSDSGWEWGVVQNKRKIRKSQKHIEAIQESHSLVWYIIVQ